MSDRFKYAKNELWKVPHFLERIGLYGSIMKHVDGRLARDNWRLSLRAEQTENGTRIRLFIINQTLLESNDAFGIRVFFNVYTTDEKLKNAFRSEKQYVMDYHELLTDVEIDLQDLTSPENALLEGGTLSVEYGLHVDSIRVDNVWQFNFEDAVFDKSKNQEIHLRRVESNMRFATCYMQHMRLHVPILRDGLVSPKPIEPTFMTLGLQIIHGVHLKLSRFELVEICAFGMFFFKCQSLLHYCETQCIENLENQIQGLNIKEEIRFAIEYGFRKYLRHLWREKELNLKTKEVLEGVEIQKMSGEMMKFLIRNFFHGQD